MRNLWLSLVLSSAFAACASPAPTSADSSVAGGQHDAIDAWTPETFPLPPGFAPTLPSGVESLRFPPGWRDPSSDVFWSYTFVMWLDEAEPDDARLEQLLVTYYDGLMRTFAGERSRELGAVRVQLQGGRGSARMQEARMQLTDAFATFEPLELRLVVERSSQGAERSEVRIQVSPRAKGDPIWRDLAAANASIRRP